MTGRTGYTALDNDDAFGFDQINALAAHFDARIGESVANAAALPASGNWAGRTILLSGTGMPVAWTGSAWIPLRPNVTGASVLSLAGLNTFNNQATYVPFPVAADATALQKSFTKYSGSTRLRATVSVSIQLTSGVAQPGWVGLRVNGVNYDVAKYRFNAGADRKLIVGQSFIANAVAGTYNVLPVFHGSGASVFEGFPDDYVSWSIEEIV